jgi:hypothetical protein
LTRRKRTAKLNREGLTRREELYLAIIARFVSRHLTTYDGSWLIRSPRPDQYDMRLEDVYAVGDLVLTYTSIGGRANKWNISLVHEKSGHNSCVLRDVFTGELCNYGNEDFKKIPGIPFHLLLPDDQYALWVQFSVACQEVDDYFLIPAKARFGEEKAIYIVREKWTDKLSEFEFPLTATTEQMKERLRIHLLDLLEERDSIQGTEDLV